jgi:hypothetical protein
MQPVANGCYPTFAAFLAYILSQFLPIAHHAKPYPPARGRLLPTSDLLHFMKTLKISTSREFAPGNGTPLWQKKYFDHILRPKESMDAVAWYIWVNPVRAALARAPGLYTFAGSFITNIPSCSTWPDFWVPPYKVKRRPPQKAAATNSSASHD